MAPSRHRSYCFTWNNYPEDISALAALPCRYIIYGKEVAPVTGTPHLQGYVSWAHPKSLSASRALLPGCHLSVARGTAHQNKVYCSKGGDVTERGECPLDAAAGGDLERARWDDFWALAKDGKIEEIDASERIRYYTTFKKIGVDYMPRVTSLNGTCGVWIYGQSGCGKTRSVLEAHPDCYMKPRNKWWDGYQREDVVLMDDVDRFDVALGGCLKHWSDFCPFIGERKGASEKIRPLKFIVTSQFTIEQIWSDLETRDALNRRFIIVEKVIGQNIII